MGRFFLLLQLALFLFQINFAFAQEDNDYPHKKYNWEKHRKITYQPSDSDLKMPAVIIQDYRFLDFVAVDPNTNNPAAVFVNTFFKYQRYSTEHVVIQIENTDKIELVKLLVIRKILNEDEVVRFQVRLLKTDGSIIELPKNAIKHVSDGTFKKDMENLAEKADKGDELEYLYTTRKKAFPLADDEYFQNICPVKEMQFAITSPSDLIFEIRPYNLPNAKTDSLTGKIRITIVSASNLAPMSVEPFSPIELNLMKVVYKLVRNKTQPGMVATVEHFCFALFPAYKTNIHWNTEGIMKELDLPGKPMEKQLVTIDSFIKNSLTLTTNFSDPRFSDAEYVFENKTGSKVGILSLCSTLFHELKIPFQMVCTSDRYFQLFDVDNMVAANFKNQIFYFPTTGKYITPFDKKYAYGFAPAYTAFNYGLFIVNNGVGNINVINGMKIDNTFQMLKADVTIAKEMNSVKVKEQFKFSGYCANEIIGNDEQSNTTMKEKVYEVFAKQRNFNAQVLNQEIDFRTVDTTGVKKITVNTDYESAALIKKGEKGYVLNIGSIIYKQTPVNDDSNRLRDIEIPYPIQYLYYLHINIPEGLKVKSLEDLKIDKAVTDTNGSRSCQFTSFYSLNGSSLDINISEVFSKTYYPKVYYKDFCQVVNAAADFNKLQLVLEKE